MKERLTWQEKLKKGLPLTDLEQVKYDAERTQLRRMRDEEEEKRVAAEREASKYGALKADTVAEYKHLADEPVTDDGVRVDSETSTDKSVKADSDSSKKGK